MVSRTDGCIVVMQESQNIDVQLDRLAKPIIAFVVSLFAIFFGHLAGVSILSVYGPLLALSLYLYVLVTIIRTIIDIW